MKLHLNSHAIKAMAESYARAFLGAAVAAYSAGMHDYKAVALAGAVAVIAPAIRAINPKDPMFGVVAQVADTEIKAVAKKAAAKAAVKPKK